MNARSIAHLFGNRLLAGILISVPLIVTILVLRIGYQAIHSVTAPFLSALGISIPGSGFIATLLLVLLIGFMATNVLGKRMIETFEKLVLRIPLIAPVYSAVKQALDSFKSLKENKKFRSVAYVEYPSEGCYLIGFVTGNLRDSGLGQGQGMTTIFLPTSPNPLTGFVIAVPDSRVIQSGLTLEQASKIIVSAGLVTPNFPADTEYTGDMETPVRIAPLPGVAPGRK